MDNGKNVNLPENIHNALTELGNIGAGNAATSLSMLLGSRLTMTPPTVDLYEFDELENILGGADATVVGVLSQIEGSMEAMMLFAISMTDAENLIKSLLNEEADPNYGMGSSVITEIANIIIGSYVASLENLCGMKLRYTLPDICIDMAGAVLSVPCTEFGKISDRALLINSEFMSGEDKINGYIMMISEEHSFDALLQKLGIGGIDE